MTKPRGVGRGRRPKVPPSLMRELHAQGVKVKQIAALLDVPEHNVYYHVGGYYRGYKRREPSNRPTTTEPDPFVLLYRAEKARRVA